MMATRCPSICWRSADLRLLSTMLSTTHPLPHPHPLHVLHSRPEALSLDEPAIRMMR